MPECACRVALSSRTYWQVVMDGLSFGDKQVACASGCRAIIDSGTSFVRGPEAVVNSFYAVSGRVCRGAQLHIWALLEGVGHGSRCLSYDGEGTEHLPAPARPRHQHFAGSCPPPLRCYNRHWQYRVWRQRVTWS